MRLHPDIPGRRALTRLIARFRADRRGATAVEFAFVALPFFGLIFAILQTSIVLFANQALQTKVDSASRKIMTGQITSADTIQTFKDAICPPGETTLFDCSKLMVQVDSFPDFTTADPEAFIEEGCFRIIDEDEDPPECFRPGDASEVVIVRAIYPWPFGFSLETFSTEQPLVAVAAFRNEPFN